MPLQWTKKLRDRLDGGGGSGGGDASQKQTFLESRYPVSRVFAAIGSTRSNYKPAYRSFVTQRNVVRELIVGEARLAASYSRSNAEFNPRTVPY